MEEIKEGFKKNREIIYILTLIVSTIVLNFKNFVSKGQSSILSFIISILYIVLWFYIIQKTKKNFLFFEYSTFLDYNYFSFHKLLFYLFNRVFRRILCTNCINFYIRNIFNRGLFISI